MNIELPDVTALLAKASLISVATVTPDSRPEAAVVGFAVTPEFEVIFRTSQASRKYTNLQQRPQIALVAWDGPVTVQYEGTAEELAGAALLPFENLYFEKNPHLEKSRNAPGFTFFKVSPQWIRYTTLTTQPWTVKEFTF
jgi:pyridoxine/pyridoxamine 5'-phosphate oxidase